MFIRSDYITIVVSKCLIIISAKSPKYHKVKVFVKVRVWVGVRATLTLTIARRQCLEATAMCAGRCVHLPRCTIGRVKNLHSYQMRVCLWLDSSSVMK